MDFLPLLSLAFFSGVITSFQPCLFPLLPTYFSYMNSYKKGKISVQEGVMVSFFLTLGILVVFLTLALLIKLGQSALSSFLLNHVPEFNLLMAIILIIVGILMISGKEMTLFYKLPGFSTFLVSETPENSLIASFSLGLAYTLIAAPCAAPVFLGLIIPVLYLDPISIVLLMVVYAIGCGLPFLLIGLLYPNFGKKIRSNYGSFVKYVKPISGVILLLMSFYLLNDYVFPYYNIQLGSFVFTGFNSNILFAIYISMFVLGIFFLLGLFLYMKFFPKTAPLDTIHSGEGE